MTVFALHNGQTAAAVAPADRGFNYGDGLFATVRVRAGRAQFLAEHLQRLQRDATRLDIALDASALMREIAALLADGGDGVLKIIVTRAAAARGYAPPPRAAGERFVLFYPQAVDSPLPDSLARAADGIAARLCRQRLSEQPVLAGIKHLNRLEQVLARAEWSDAAVAEGLMLDTAGRLVEGTMSNVFLVRDGRALTPRLHRCGVAGVIREVILRRLSARCVPVEESDLTLEDLYAADEVFLTNSLIGIWPVQKIECVHKAVGPVTRAFQTALAALADGS